MTEKTIIVAAIRTSAGLLNKLGEEALDMWTVILNVGSRDGISLDQQFIIYSRGEEIFDPATGESLGQYEIVRGRGKVSQVQESLCTLRSTETKQVARPMNSLAASLGAGGESQWQTTPAPFRKVAVGDLARRV